MRSFKSIAEIVKSTQNQIETNNCKKSGSSDILLKRQKLNLSIMISLNTITEHRHLKYY